MAVLSMRSLLAWILQFLVFIATANALPTSAGEYDLLNRRSNRTSQWAETSRLDMIKSMYAWEGFVYSIEVKGPNPIECFSMTFFLLGVQIHS
jgi:hypothetical protein